VATLSKTLTIRNPKGLHVRAATVLANALKAFEAEVTLSHGEQSANAKSVMHLLLLTAGQGSQVEVSVVGKQAQEALEVVSSVIEDGFGEND
jgi:phosphotransferase system HPr (HPr) family protein